MKAKIEAIKTEFLSRLDDEKALTGLRGAVASLQVIGVDKHIACQMATHWAVEAGFFDPEDEDLAERQAEQAVA